MRSTISFVRAGEVHHAREIIKEDIIHELLCLSVYEDSLPVPATQSSLLIERKTRKSSHLYMPNSF